MSKKRKVLYIAGPGNVIGTLKQHANGQKDNTQVANTYSGQFIDACLEMGFEGHIIAIRDDSQTLKAGSLVAQHITKPLAKNSGAFFHLNQLLMGFMITQKAFGLNAKSIVISGTSCHWFTLFISALLGKRIIPSIHCVLYSDLSKRTKINRFFDYLNRLFFRCCVDDVVVVSEAVKKQVVDLYGCNHESVKVFSPTYQPDLFESFQPKSLSSNTIFELLYVGRIEENKGVFDLITIMNSLENKFSGRFKINICGSGSAEVALKKAIGQRGLSNCMIFNGHCSKYDMQSFYSRCHAVIVPTRSDFVEGFNKVVAESVLCYRPVITSRICPALFSVYDAAIEVEPDEPQSYSDAIERLAFSPEFYEKKSQECEKYRSVFFDQEKSWQKILEKIF